RQGAGRLQHDRRTSRRSRSPPRWWFLGVPRLSLPPPLSGVVRHPGAIPYLLYNRDGRVPPPPRATVQKECPMLHAPHEWRSAYRDDGFLIVQDLLDSALVSTLGDGLEKITGGVASLPPHLREKIFLERDHVRNNPQWYTGILAPE